MNQPQMVLESAFHLDSLEPVDDPTGGSASWYRYVISQGPGKDNPITGTKSGTHAEVSLQVRDMVQRLNERFAKVQGKKK